MFTIDATVDAVQTAKKTFVNTFVTNDKIKEAMIGFVEAQSEYTKKAAKAGTEAVTTVTSEAVKAAQEMAKFDYIKATQDFFKAFQPASKK